MIILSNSIPKSASTLMANYQEDILKCLNKKNGQLVLKDKFQGRYINYPNRKILLKLLAINLMHGTIVIKCHWPYLKFLDRFCLVTNTKMTINYRDPRDMILSMIDHGEKSRKMGDGTGAFSECFNVIDLIPRQVELMKRLELFLNKPYVHGIKYENMILNPRKVLKEMNQFLNIELDDLVLNEIISNRNKVKTTSHNFNKGTTERWKEEMSQNEKQKCLEAFKPFLEKYNYEL
mgnify:CR=1 FL=1